MRICILGSDGEYDDEGMKNFSSNIYEEMSKTRHDLIFIDINQWSSPQFWKKIVGFDPEYIHITVGPSMKSLTLLRILKQITGAKTIATALQPNFNDFSRRLLWLVKPELMLTLSSRSTELFRTHGYNTEQISCGVDQNTFSPVSPGEKSELRSEVGFPQHERIFLHVGHLEKGRNVHELVQLVEFGEVLIIGSPATQPDEGIIDFLKSNGCNVIFDYIKSIERYYKISDFYVFPTPVENTQFSIQLPLSVLEAMACNLAVISTPFGGLPDTFNEGGGLKFINNLDEITDELLAQLEAPSTREKVSKCTWPNTANSIINNYQNI